MHHCSGSHLSLVPLLGSGLEGVGTAEVAGSEAICPKAGDCAVHGSGLPGVHSETYAPLEVNSAVPLDVTSPE